MSSEKLILLKCGDGKTLEMDDATGFMSESIKSAIMRARRQHKDWHRIVWKLSVDPLLCKIPSELLEKVIHYCERHAHADDDLHAFDRQFVHGADPQLLLNLRKAASVLDIDGLYELASSAFYNVLDQIGVDMEQYATYHRNVPF